MIVILAFIIGAAIGVVAYDIYLKKGGKALPL